MAVCSVDPVLRLSFGWPPVVLTVTASEKTTLMVMVSLVL